MGEKSPRNPERAWFPDWDFSVERGLCAEEALVGLSRHGSLTEGKRERSPEANGLARWAKAAADEAHNPSSPRLLELTVRRLPRSREKR